jgi:hypothetical protein
VDWHAGNECECRAFTEFFSFAFTITHSDSNAEAETQP